MTQPPSRTIPEPPRARVAPTRLETHGVVRVDDYYWLRERDNPEVTAYLEAENEHTRAVMEPTEALQETLFAEIKGRIKQTDMSVPYREGDYSYYTRFEDGREYPIYCRSPTESPQPSPRPSEQVLLDVNLLAEGHDFCEVSGRQVSPNQHLIAYATDLEGRRIHTIHIKDLMTGKTRGDELTGVTSNLVWANDSRTLFYASQDPATLRWFRVYRHRLGASQADDTLVFEEPDETFHCEVGKSRSKRYLLIASYQTLSTEYRYLDADAPDGSFAVFLPRARDHEYHIDHYRDRFYIRTNRVARNF